MQFQTEVNALISAASNKEAGLFTVFTIHLEIIKTLCYFFFFHQTKIFYFKNLLKNSNC